MKNVQKNIKTEIVKDSREFHDCWYIKIYENKLILKIYELMYIDAKLYMQRKENIFNVMR